jgi:APA family basic amino acid/polyamine antiporter
MPIAEIAASPRVGAAVAERTLGTAGGAIVSITILLSILGAANGHILTTPRLLFAMSRDGLIFEKLGQIHPRFQTMSFNFAMQGLWAAVLVVTGSFETLVTYAMFAAFIFYGLTVPGVIILRHKYPDRERPYRMWGYPVTPVLFTATAAWFVVNALITTPGPSLAAILIISTGIPVYYMWQSRIRRMAALPGEVK